MFLSTFSSNKRSLCSLPPSEAIGDLCAPVCLFFFVCLFFCFCFCFFLFFIVASGFVSNRMITCNVAMNAFRCSQ